MNGKVCMVTGTTSGIGKEIALSLAAMGAIVVMVARDPKKGERVRQEIIRKTANDTVDLLIADLSIINEIHCLAKSFKDRYYRLDVLVNNAGGIFGERVVTSDGFEMSFALNHLAPFLLTDLLHDLLLKSAPSRIVNVSSGAHRFGRLDFNDLQKKRGRYSAMRAYSNAKLMNIMYTFELARRLDGTGVTANVLHPGVVKTNFGKDSMGRGFRLLMWLSSPFLKTPREGAETAIYLASSPEVETMSGLYFKDSRAIDASKSSYDIESQKKLWHATKQLLQRGSEEMAVVC